MSESQRRLAMPSYRDLLHTAYTLGRADGQLAADFEPPESAGPSRPRCRGRDPADFARQLWSLPGGDPPAGLEINAPHWYAHGFQEALAEARAVRHGSLSHATSTPCSPRLPARGASSPETAEPGLVAATEAIPASADCVAR